MICASCQTPARPGQKFCRSCGSVLALADPPPGRAAAPPVECPSCQHPNHPGGRFCRACGTALTLSGELARPTRAMPLATDDQPTIVGDDAAEAETTQADTLSAPLSLPPSDPAGPVTATRPASAVGTPCEMCGAPANGRRFCLDCSPLPDTHEQTTPDAAPLAAEPAIVQPSRRKRLMLVALVGVLLVVAGAATAFALRDDATPPPKVTSTARSAAAGVSPPAVAVDPTGTTAAPAGGAGQTTTAPAETATTPTATTPATPGGGEANAGGQDPPTAVTSGPEKALREHWQAIGTGDFMGAYRRFSSRYRGQQRVRELESWDPRLQAAG